MTVNRATDRSRHIRECHPVQHDRVVTLEHLFGNQTNSPLILSRAASRSRPVNKPANRNIAAEVSVLERLNAQLGFETRIPFVDHLSQHRSEECSGEYRRRFLINVIGALESFRNAREVVRKRADHPDTVFDLRIAP